MSIRTNVKNNGTTTITSFDYSWTDGVNTHSQTITGVSIAPQTSYDVNAMVPYSTLAGVTTVTASVSNINGGVVELNTTNNSVTYDVEGVTANPLKKYFAEEATGTWCQWCPRGAVYMAYMRATYPNQFVGVAVHNNDPMTITAYDAAVSASVAGYPSLLPNRNPAIDPSGVESDFIDYISVAPDVVVGGTASLNLATNQITIALNANFVNTLTGDYRFMAVVAEDSVTGTATTYNQSNAYGNNSNGPMGGFESFATTVPAASMNYDFVNRTLLGTFAGQTGSLPATVNAGTPYNYTFTTPVVATLDKAQLYVAAVVIDAGTGLVLNAVKIPVSITTAINQPENSLSGSFVYPNPTADALNLSLHLSKNSSVAINVTDITGKVVMTQELNNMIKGDNKMVWNLSKLAAGMYNLTASTPDGKITLKFVKE